LLRIVLPVREYDAVVGRKGIVSILAENVGVHMARMGNSIGVEALEALLAGRTETGAVPGLSLAVVKGDRLVWTRGFGFADLATSTPATPRTSYLWFSMTKTVTATAVVRLAEEGELDLDAPADEYYGGLKVVSQPTPVTVRHLLSHSSGLANPVPIRWVYAAAGPVPDRRAFVERLLGKNRRLRFAPGERAGYSNLGYLVLGEVIAEVTGTSYEDHVRQEILSPLGMERTGFYYPDDEGGAAATGYQPLWKPFTPLFRAALPRGIVGARQGRYVSFEPFYVKGPAYGGLVGGVDEATRFLMLHLNGEEMDGTRLLSAESVAEMQRITPRGGKRDFGLGWFRSHKALQKRPAFVEHLGGGAGFWNVMRIYPEESLGIVLMGNTTSYDHESVCDAIVGVPWK
jgi:CubicO group peptidase (beta-lactamase class C family)